MDMLYQIAAGLVVTWLLGFGVGPLLRHVKKSIVLVPPSESTKERWQLLVSNKGDISGKVLGHLERLLFFFAFWGGSFEIVAGWLAFKVASKWNVWTNVISVPKTLSGVDDLDFLIARRRWGAQRLMGFLIGTLANILIAYLGVLAGRHLFLLFLYSIGSQNISA